MYRKSEARTCQKLKGCWIELVDGGIDVEGRAALLAGQPFSFSVVGHVIIDSISPCSTEDVNHSWTFRGE